MATEIILPKVDMDMTTGRISRWLVAEGATVKQGDPLFEIETDKAAMEIEAPASGTLRHIRVMEGVDIPVGEAVAWIYGESEAAEPIPPAAASAARREAAKMPQTASLSVTVAEPAIPSPQEAKMRATPLARRLAKQRNIDLAKLTGSGPNGRIQAKDVDAAPSVTDAKAPTASKPLLRPTTPQPIESPPDGMAVGGTATWLRRGTGTPIVLIHGFGSETASWRPFLAAFERPGPILSIDLPGHGAAVDVPARSFDELVAYAETQLVTAGVSVAHLTGHSLGSAVAVALAAGSALEARSLFLLAPAGLGADINAGFIQGFAGARDEAALRTWMRELVADPAVFSDSFVKATMRARADGRLPEAQARLATYLFSNDAQLFSVRPLLDHLAIPTKVIAGTADRVIPSHHLTGLPGPVAIHLFAGLGHMPHLEDRVTVARLLRELVQGASNF
jgi:pyruvate dehydrogenase E2 component (dihydrolipoamide acetyltransferase)